MRELNGKPLVCYTIEAALESGCFKKIIVSSDDEEILEMAGGYDGVTAEKRSDNLSGDKEQDPRELERHHVVLEQGIGDDPHSPLAFQ